MAGHSVIMPKIGMYLEDIRLVEWLRGEGSQVARGDLLFTLETDKITSDVEAEESGWLRHLVEADEAVAIGTPVGTIFSTREEYEAAVAAGESTESPQLADAQSELFLGAIRAAETHAVAAASRAQSPPARARDDRSEKEGGAAKISPRARAAIAAAGLSEDDVAAIVPTGPQGRMTDRDVQAYLETAGKGESAAPEVAAATEGVAVAGRVPLRGRRRAIADRMVQSLQTSAQLTSVLELDVSPIVAWRARTEPPVGVTAILVALCGRALVRHPLLNSRIAGDEIELLAETNVGFAVHTDDGVIAPVIRGADRRALRDIGREVAELTERARAGALRMSDIDGATFTLSNSGVASVDLTTAIINPPQAAVLWTGRIRERAVVVDAEVVARPTIQACLTFDHRILDGVPAAEFLGTFEELLRSFPGSVEAGEGDA